MEKEIRQEIAKIKTERKGLFGLLGIAAIVLLATGTIVLEDTKNTKIIGLATYDTLEPEYKSVSGGSPGSTLSFEKIPSIKARTGEKIRIKVKANKEGVTFSDNSPLFEIRQDGTIEFTAEKPGHNRVFVIAAKGKEYYYQDFMIEIEE